MVSRRVILAGASCGLLGGGKAQTAGTQTPERAVVAKSYENADALAISPDGKYFCLYATRRPFSSFRLDRNGIRSLNPKTREGDEGFKIIEFGTWNTVYSRKLWQSPRSVSFFADSRRVYLDTGYARVNDAVLFQRMLIDIATGQAEERMVEFSKIGHEHPQYSYRYKPIRGNTLLGHGSSTRTIRHVGFLFHTKWPELAVTEKVPYSVHKVPEGCVGGDVWTCANPTISDDRRFLVHPDGRTVIYRQIENLEVLWKFDAGAGLSLVNLAVSGDGGLVVLATARGAGDRTGPCYVAVLDGRNGQVLLKLPVYGDAGVAVSGKRKLLVVGQATELDSRTGDTQSSLLLYDLGSGKYLETLNHYRRRIPRGAADMGTFGTHGLQFTPDGRYLVSSTATHTKVWMLN